jgi:hypothetical protein
MIDQLSDMSVKRRHTVLWAALAEVLQSLSGQAATNDVVSLMALQLQSTERQLISSWLVKAAPLVPEAKQGDTFQKFGRTMRHWVWSPRPKAPHTKAKDKANG